MGGDHKCPVCQATFTRPQHVARHMRSHTGDRPYKCVYCGDQFARSDLLSRHVNKCHASEKPVTQSGTRRKGSAAATRATTSKQACDQCVQSSLPCDGCNPCAKCIQRKCRCTFVKFHRQTAPAGPGHAAPQAIVPAVGQPLPPASMIAGRLGPYPHAMHAPDPMGLGPVPLSAASSTSTSINDPLYSDNFNFSLYPSSAPPGSLPSESAADYASRYRANAAQLLRRDAIPGITHPHQHGLASSSWPAWSHQDTRYPPHGQDGTPKDLGHFLPGISHSSGHGPYQQGGFYTNGRRPSIDLDFSSSDSTSHSDHSVPSSATSSSIHLPLEPMDMSMPMSQSYQGSLGDGSSSYTGDQGGRNSTQAQHQQQQQRSPSQPSQYEGRDGGFSSAFGLMSLDDPNVIAGLATDGAPFFSHAGMDTNLDPDATPMQVPPPSSTNSATRTPLQNRPSTSTGYHWSSGFSLNPPGRDREADTKELKDFWKHYMRTPLSGPGPGPVNELPPLGSAQGLKADATPGGGTYRRPRVNSLPSVKTPLGPPGSSQYHNHPFAIPTIQAKKTGGEGAGAGGGAGEAGGSGAGGVGSRTVHGTAEDLRSYEAAVLARKAPTNLNLNPRRRGTMSGGVSGGGVGKQDRSSPPHLHGSEQNQHQRQQQQNQQPPSSSWVNGFGGGQVPPPANGMIVDSAMPIPRLTLARDGGEYGVRHGGESPVHDRHSSSRESSVGVSDGGSEGDGHGGGGGGDASQRPPFKRLPSQTLEPVNTKRTQLMREGVAGSGGLGSGAGVPSVTNLTGGSAGVHTGQQGQGQMSLMERRRRMSGTGSGPGEPLELGPLPQ